MYNSKWYLEPLTTEEMLSSVFNFTLPNLSATHNVNPESKDNLLYLKYKLAGYSKDDIKIDISQTSNLLNYKSIIVKANNKEYGLITYTSSVPKNIEEKLTKANLKNGILTLTFVPEKIKSALTNLKIEVE